MKEIWKDIRGYEGLYQISNFGNIKSMARKTLYIRNQIPGCYTQQTKILKPDLITKGYLGIVLTNNIRKSYKIHRLVAQTFIPNPENKPQVNHKDCNKQNNHVENLEWVTNQENMLHAKQHGIKFGSSSTKNGMAKFNKQQIIQIRALYQQMAITDLALKYQVDITTIHKIVHNKSYKNI